MNGAQAATPLDATIVIIGAGQSGGRCAEALRAGGHQGNITLIGDEPYRPYERPALSKALLDGSVQIDSIFLREAQWYEKNRIQLLTGKKAISIDWSDRYVELSDGMTLRYDKLILATGARPKPLSLPGGDLPEVFTLRTLDDCLVLRERLKPGQRLTIVGAGFIGLEVASIAIALGASVSVLEATPWPVSRVSDIEIGKTLQSIHQSAGVDLRTNVQIKAIVRKENHLRIEINNQAAIDADIVLVGIGVTPATQLASQSGLEVDNGIVVDEKGRTNINHIYAIGDCAAFFHPKLGSHIRLEQWQHAQNHALAVAAHLCGDDTVYDALPWGWSTQYDKNLHLIGWPQSWDKVTWRGSPKEDTAILFYFSQGRLVAAHGFGIKKDLPHVRKLIASQPVLPPQLLADLNVKLADLAQNEYRK